MKKAILFLVLGLGLVFSVNANACFVQKLVKNYEQEYLDDMYCDLSEVGTVIIQGKKYYPNTWGERLIIDRATFYKLVQLQKKLQTKFGGQSKYYKHYKKYLAELIPERKKILIEYLENNKTQVTKAEPSQTQEVAEKEVKKNYSIVLSDVSDVAEAEWEKDERFAWTIWLNPAALDELTKSIVKIDSSDMLININSYPLPFREPLEYLFGKKKIYINSALPKISQRKIADIFVTKKDELDKYPYKTILGLAYFEFFYAGELEDTRKEVTELINNRKKGKGISLTSKKEMDFRNKTLKIWPDGRVCKGYGPGVCSVFQISKISSIYNLNEVRKKMRESIGFTLDNESSEVIKYYITLSKYLKNTKPEKQKLNSKDKKIIKLSQSFSKFLSSYEKNLKFRLANLKTLNDPNNHLLELDWISYINGYERSLNKAHKRFYKDLNKNYKKLEKISSKISKLKDKDNETAFKTESYKVLYEKITEIMSTTNQRLANKTIDYNIALDSICFVNKLLKVTKSKSIKNRYDQIWPLDFNIEDALNENEITQLIMLGKNQKRSEFINNKKFQTCMLNLVNNNYPVKEIVTDIENEFDIKINSIKMDYKTINEMKTWKKSDWANSWKGSIPLNLKDEKGNLVDFSQSDIEDIKAQLALNNFNTLLDNDEINNLNIETQDIQNSIQDIRNTNVSNLLNQDFSITLDNYSKILAEDAINTFGNQFDAKTIQEIRDNANFENLTAITNMGYGTNMTSAEYKSYWENAQYMDSTSTWADVTRGVDLISNLSSFDAAAAAKELGADLQTVADSIAQAASVGISTDLEGAAQGLGYDSFSDAVNAYNAEHGTNYTEAEAKEALGQ